VVECFLVEQGRGEKGKGIVEGERTGKNPRGVRTEGWVDSVMCFRRGEGGRG